MVANNYSLTMEQINSQLNQRENIRNISVFSFPDHGKSTLLEYLNLYSGINIKKINNDDMNNQDKYLKSKILPLYYKTLENNNNNQTYLINLIDNPSSNNFDMEHASEFRITDGLLIVLDCVEGVLVVPRLEQKLRIAVLNELLKPSLLLNKIDRLFLDLKNDQQDNYLLFSRIIQDFNNTLSISTSNTIRTTTTTTTTEKTTSGFEKKNLDEIISPNNGNVLFGSALHGWGFTTETFAKFYSAKFGIPTDKMVARLWGENYYNAEAKRWDTVAYSVDNSTEGGKVNTKLPLKRSFIQFILDPIMKLVHVLMDDNKEQLKSILSLIHVVLNLEESKKSGKELLFLILKKWLPLNDSLLGMCVNHLPSPIEAQKYRVANLYEGPMDDECANSIRECNPNGPLMLYISKLLPSTLKRGRYYALGRIFSGSIHCGQKVNILNSSYNPLDSKNKTNKHSDIKIRDILFINNNQIESIGGGSKGGEIVSSGGNEKLEILCGNIVCVYGIDQYIEKSSTITTSEISHNIKSIKYSNSPIIKISVEPKNPGDLPNLIEGLKRLVLEDPNIMNYIENTGENIICVPTEQYIERVLLDLSYHTRGVPLKSSDPFISFRESVSKVSSQNSLSKSPNKHNRLYMNAEPLPLALQSDIEKKFIDTTVINNITISTQQPQNNINENLQKLKERSDYLVNEYGWNKDEPYNIWSFGPEMSNDENFRWFGGSNGQNNLGDRTCILVNKIKGVHGLNESKEHIINGFRWAAKQGALCDEPMKGIKFNLLDVVYVSDAIHRGGGQIIPTSRRVVYASQLLSGPTLNEPWYSIEISTFNQHHLKDIYSIINNRRGIIIGDENKKYSNFNGTDYLENEKKNWTLDFNKNNTIVKAHLPVLESFGFDAEIRFKSFGTAYLESCLLDHWSPIGDAPVIDSELAKKIVSDVRKRKGLENDYPDINKFLDRIY